jgi:hypothetical protein
MAVIQPQINHMNKDTCATVTWPGLTLRSGTCTCPGGSPTLNWLSGAHGLTAINVGASMYLSPTGGTAGLYQLTAYLSPSTATFALVGGSNASAVSSVACGLGDVGAPYSQPDAALDRTLQVHGTFGASGNMSLYGSNDNQNFAVSKDNTGTALACANVTVRNVFDGPLYYVPMVTVGDATTNLTAILAMRIQLPRPFQ